MGYETWHDQDTLQLSVDEWRSLLNNSEIFNAEAMELILYVYNQPMKRSAVNDIAEAFNNVHVNKITATNRKISKKIYALYDKVPPLDEDGRNRWWNNIFDGVKEKEKDENGHYIWQLRENLIEALDKEYKDKN